MLEQFWEAVAILWLELPPEIQRVYAEKYPKGSKRPTAGHTLKFVES